MPKFKNALNDYFGDYKPNIVKKEGKTKPPVKEADRKVVKSFKMSKKFDVALKVIKASMNAKTGNTCNEIDIIQEGVSLFAQKNGIDITQYL